MNQKFFEVLTRQPIAHRGYFSNSGPFPENSLGAILEAVRLGFAVEFDVMLSSDEDVVVFHDDNLVRMCGRSERVSALTSSELSSVVLKNSSEHIPSLSKVLSAVGGKTLLVIELKSFSKTGLQTDGRLEAKVLEHLNGYSGPVALKSFNPFSVTELLRLRGAQAQWPVGFISCDYSKDDDFAFMSNEQKQCLSQLVGRAAPECDFISYNIKDLSEELSKKIRSQVPLMVWTVRTEEQFEKAARLADNIVFEWRGVELK